MIVMVGIFFATKDGLGFFSLPKTDTKIKYFNPVYRKAVLMNYVIGLSIMFLIDSNPDLRINLLNFEFITIFRIFRIFL